MAKPQNVVLVAQNKTVSPRQGIHSKDWNDHVRATTKDSSNIKTQLNGLTLSALKLHDNAWVSTGTYHGIDANTIYWNSTAEDTNADPKLTIAEKVTAVESAFTSFTDQLDATMVKFNTAALTTAGNIYVQSLNDTNDHVQKVLEDVLLTIPSLQEGGQINIGLDSLTIDGNIVQPITESFSIGTSAIPWSSGFFTTLVADTLLVKTTTTLQSTTVTTGDSNIVLASGATSSAEASGGGITLTTGQSGQSETILYDDSLTGWNFSTDIYVNGAPIAGVSDAVNVAYSTAQTGDIPSNVEAAANAEAALDQLGLNQVFDLAATPVKRIPVADVVNGTTGTAGMTVKEWLVEMFFPTIEASVGFNNIALQELGTTFIGPVTGVVTPADETAFNSLTLTDDASGSYTLSAESGNWSQAVSETANTNYTITLNAGNPAYTKTAQRSLQFVPPVYYAAGNADLTETQIKAQNQSDLRTTQAGSHTFSVTSGYFYILIPTTGSFSAITSIIDPNGFQNIAAVDYLDALGPGGNLQDAPTTVSITMADGVTSVNYYAYRWIDETTQSNYTLTFS
jgi:hypothetical protein